MHQIYYVDATHPIWQLPQVLQASGQRDSKLSGSGTALAGLEFRLAFLAGSPERWGRKHPYPSLSSLLPPDGRRIGSLRSASEAVLFWNNTLCTGSSTGPALLRPPGKKSLLNSYSAGIKTHHKIQLISPGFCLRRKSGKQRVAAVLKHFPSCLKGNIAAFFCCFKATFILILRLFVSH